mmetsp:Transcript_800/g.1138  ORF Transcript_800/g.1138 Transcript_800/m.1138 type:complete len:287 (-) Transcript_800:9-869(-)
MTKPNVISSPASPFDPLLQKRPNSTFHSTYNHNHNDNDDDCSSSSSYVSIPLMIHDRTMTLTGTLCNNDDDDEKEWKGALYDDTIAVTICCCNNKQLTWKKRLIGCVICNVGGVVILGRMLFRYRDLVNGDPSPFLLKYSSSQILAILGSTFLLPPQKLHHQLRYATSKTTTAIVVTYLFSTSLIIAILFLCYIFDRPTGYIMSFLLLLCVSIQYGCIVCYTLSHVPLARHVLRNVLFGVQSCHDGEDDIKSDGYKSSSCGKNSESGGAVGWIGTFQKKNSYEEII